MRQQKKTQWRFDVWFVPPEKWPTQPLGVGHSRNMDNEDARFELAEVVHNKLNSLGATNVAWGRGFIGLKFCESCPVLFPMARSTDLYCPKCREERKHKKPLQERCCLEVGGKVCGKKFTYLKPPRNKVGAAICQDCRKNHQYEVRLKLNPNWKAENAKAVQKSRTSPGAKNAYK